MKNKIVNIINICIISISILVLLLIFNNKNAINLNHYDGDNQWLSASTIKFVNNWLYDGILNDKFIMYEDYKSIEFENNSREVYNSYPPGCIIPVYLFAKINHLNKITIQNMKDFIFFEYILCAILLGIFFYLFSVLIFKDKIIKYILPVVLALFWAYLPFNFYYFRNVYFSDIAIIPIAILFLINELLLYNNLNSSNLKLLKLISFVLVFIGVFTDYYFLSLSFACFIIRVLYNYKEYQMTLLNGLLLGFKKSTDLILGIIFSCFLFIYQVSKIPNGFNMLRNKFNERTGTNIDATMYMNHEINFKSESFFSFLRLNFGNSIPSMLMYFILLILVYSFFSILSSKIKKNTLTVYFLLLVSLSVITHSILLYNHTMRHEFSILKFCIALVFFLFIFIYWVYCLLEKFNKNSIQYIFICMVSIFFSLSVMITLIYWDNKYYTRRTRQLKINKEGLASFIKENTIYNDVIFSPFYEIKTNPPLDLSISEKRVYKIDSIQEIKNYRLSLKSNIIILLNKDSILKYNKWHYDNNKQFKEYQGWVLVKN